MKQPQLNLILLLLHKRYVIKLGKRYTSPGSAPSLYLQSDLLSILTANYLIVWDYEYGLFGEKNPPFDPQQQGIGSGSVSNDAAFLWRPIAMATARYLCKRSFSSTDQLSWMPGEFCKVCNRTIVMKWSWKSRMAACSPIHPAPGGRQSARPRFV